MGFAIDLHMHSRYSADGEFEPARLVEMAGAAGMSCIAVTDHNQIAGVPEALAAGAAAGVRVVPCVELDCLFGGVELHILAYFADTGDSRYQKVADEVEEQELAASQKRIDLARELGLVVDAEEVAKKAVGGVVTPELVAEVALADPRNDGAPALEPYRPGGARSDNPYVNFYWDHCSQGKPLHIPLVFMSLEECVRLVGDTGGVAIMAHPGQSLRNRPELFDGVVACGIRGVEAYSSYHSPEARRHWAAEAAKRGLLVTCGSDFHGKTKPAIALGGHGADEETMRSIAAGLYAAAGREWDE